MRIAYSYIRFSSTDQAHGNSLARQTEASSQLAERHGWKLDTTLGIRDLGRSAFKTGQQVGLRNFLQAIEDGTVKSGSVLIVEQLDRLSRDSLSNADDIFRSILKSGVDIAVLNPERIYTKASLDEPFVLMELVWQFYMANQESAKKSFRAFDNWKRKRAEASSKPMTTRRPAWLDLADDKKFVLNESKAQIILRMFEWAIDGHGDRQITNRLNREGIVNIAFGTKKGSRKHWNQSYVEYIMQSPTVMGEYQPHRFEGEDRIPTGEAIKGYYPAAVPESLYWEAQAARHKRRKKVGRLPKDMMSLFTGIVFDAQSKTSMRLANSSQIEKKKGCMRRLASYHCGLKSSWQYEPFESAFLEFVSELDPDDLIPKKTVDRLPGLIENLRQTNERIEKTQAAILDGGQYETLLELLRRLEDQRKGLEVEIDNERTEQANDDQRAFQRLTTISKLIRRVPSSERDTLRLKLRQLIRSVVKEIWMLIEEYPLQKPVGKIRRVKICTVQVFFESGHRTFWLVRWGHRHLRLGQAETVFSAPANDLRSWNGHHLYRIDDDVVSGLMTAPDVVIAATSRQELSDFQETADRVEELVGKAQWTEEDIADAKAIAEKLGDLSTVENIVTAAKIRKAR